MRIAVLAPIAWRTPPLQYGPWEQVASNMAEGMVALGMDVTLFASGDSVTSGTLRSVCARPYAGDHTADVKVNECLHISEVFEHAADFDIIHNHYDFLPLTYTRLITTPVVTTIHGFSSPLILPVYKKYNINNHYISISYASRHAGLRYKANVYNGIDTGAFTFVAEPANYLLFFGRIHPDKGTLEAIYTARNAGIKLIIAGLIQDAVYFEQQIKPLIDGKQVIYAGNCGPAERNELLGHAMALLHLISFEEPFGLSVAEAMCCGTPVIAFSRGSMPELIVDGITGFLVHTVEAAAEAVKQVVQIDRKACRMHAVHLFSKEKMCSDYLEVYKDIIYNS